LSATGVVVDALDTVEEELRVDVVVEEEVGIMEVEVGGFEEEAEVSSFIDADEVSLVRVEDSIA